MLQGCGERTAPCAFVWNDHAFGWNPNPNPKWGGVELATVMGYRPGISEAFVHFMPTTYPILCATLFRSTPPLSRFEDPHIFLKFSRELMQYA